MFIIDRDDFANKLNIPIKKLTYLLYIKKIDNCYCSFEIPKKDGTPRKICTPILELKEVQRKLADLLYEKQQQIWKEANISPNISHGFEKGKNIITNAKIHRNRRFVLNFDLENFFESFHFGRVKGYFQKNRNFKLEEDVATIMAQLTCYQGVLPQGAPTSPIITNLICQILDFKLLDIAKKYKLDYTRYADDLTFSTNNHNFLECKNDFMKEITAVITKSGFKINEKKTRLQYRDSKQTVTGLVVNRKLNVDREYARTTKAMAHSLYTRGSFIINGQEGSMATLEGRFAFINQLDRYDNNCLKKKRDVYTLNAREKQYQRFLFYKYFWYNSKPLIVTEGKTDVLYLKAALKKYCSKYPLLIEKKSNGTYEYKINFFKRTKRMRYFFNIALDGADIMNNIYDLYNIKKNICDTIFKRYGLIPKNPVILLFDNEIEAGKNKPIGKFKGYTMMNDANKNLFKKNLSAKMSQDSNLYLVTNPIVDGKPQCEIEDLFNETTRAHTIDGKTLSLESDYATDKHYGKEIFSKYIYGNYARIDFSNFIPLLDNINEIVKQYN